MGVVSTSLNINQQATKLFVNYSRSIVLLHKWSITPPENIYIDMHCQGTASSPTQEIGHTIVYSVKGSQNEMKLKSLRGEPFNEKAFLERLKMIDDFVSDHCMEILSRLNVKYSKLFAPWRSLGSPPFMKLFFCTLLGLW